MDEQNFKGENNTGGNMHRSRSRLVAAALAVALGAPFFGGVSPAGAIPAGNGCNASGVPAALISWYPANPGSMSALHVACSYNNNTGTSQISASFSVHDITQAVYHNGSARSVVSTTGALAGATTIQLDPAALGGNGIVGLPTAAGPAPAATQMNRVLTGTGIDPRTTITWMTAGGLASLSRPVGIAGVAPGTTLTIENSSARTVLDGASAGPDLLNSTEANFTAADIGLTVSGTGIPNNTTILAINTPSQAQLSANAIGYTLTNPTVSIGGSIIATTTRQVTGATTTTAVRIVSTAAAFAATDLGLRVTGVCDQVTTSVLDDQPIPVNTYITTVVNATTVDTTGGLPNPATGCTLQIGEANANAPAQGDVAAQQGVQLNLSGLVPGSDDCANEQPEGFGIAARWNNAASPTGGFQPAGIPGATNRQPGPTQANPTAPGTQAVGQLYFDTSAADFSGFVIQRKALTAGDPNASIHYDVVFPFAPTSLAMCPGSATSPGLTYSLYVNATTISQGTLPTGTGRPGTGQIRNIKPSTTGGYTGTATVKSDSGVTFSPASAFTRTCFYPAGYPNAANFQCGPG